MKQIPLFTLFIACFAVGFAQIEVEQEQTNQDEEHIITNTGVDDIIESLAEQYDEEADFSELVEELLYYLDHKMNINAPDYEALASLFGLTRRQIHNLKHYLKEYGQLRSLYELALIEGMDAKTISHIINYIEIVPVVFKEKFSLKKAFKYGNSEVLMRYGQVLEEQKGFSPPQEGELERSPNARYLGSPQAYWVRYKFNYKNQLQFGLTAEKDAGETFFKGANKYGFDFYSAHFFIRDMGVVKSLAIGDYQLSYGQGLAMNMGFAMQKPDNSVAISRNSSGLKPYSSANEYNYLRGIAAAFDCKVLDFTLFYSYKYLDATVIDDTLSAEDAYIEAIQRTGYHRTVSETSRKNAIGQHLAGVHLDFPFRVAHIGATAFYTYFEKPLQRNLTYYNAYEFKGQENINASIDYKVLIRKTTLFGEVAMSQNTALAAINGVIFDIDPRFILSVLHRYYGRDYQALNANAFGESSTIANEQGVFMGFQAILSSKFILYSHADYFKFNWLQYRIDAPSDGFSAQTKLEFLLNSKFSAYARFRYKTKAINCATEYYNEIFHTDYQSYRLHFSYYPLSEIVLKSRLEIVNYKPNTHSSFHQGYLIYQDVGLRLQKIPLTLTARFAIFDAYSYDERIYTYEDDMLYGFSIPSFYNKGTRIYLVAKASITKHLDAWFRIAQTFYRNQNSISSGLTYIDGNTKTDLKLQLRVKF
ncbi:MAG: hypothetical protein FWH36_02465 [Lentimicrobiaceae bacterium]|nr:hypothetical protein [Lentimicrobiaceae bacterium]